MPTKEFLKKIFSKSEPEILGEIGCGIEGASLVVRARSGTNTIYETTPHKEEFVRQYYVSIKFADDQKRDQFVHTHRKQSDTAYSDGSVIIGSIHGDRNDLGTKILHFNERAAHIVIGGEKLVPDGDKLVEIIRNDIASHAAEYDGKAAKPGRRR